MTKDQHVMPHKNGWQVKGGGNLKATVVTKTQADSMKVAKVIAQNNKSEVLIHGMNGKIREKNSYGNDPRVIKG